MKTIIFVLSGLVALMTPIIFIFSNSILFLRKGLSTGLVSAISSGFYSSLSSTSSSLYSNEAISWIYSWGFSSRVFIALFISISTTGFG